MGGDGRKERERVGVGREWEGSGKGETKGVRGGCSVCLK